MEDATAAEAAIAGPLLWLPLLAAVLFASGAMLLKRSAQWPVGAWRTIFVANICTVVVFLPMLGWEGRFPGWADLWQPLAVAALFLTGQVTAIIALTRGDVSVAAPVMGLKIIIVALLATLFVARPLPPDLWPAAVLATLGVVLLNARGPGADRARIGISIGFGLAAAVAYGLFDICVQLWAPRWGGTGFLPIVFLASGILSLGLVPLFEGRLARLPRGAWPWLAGGGLLMALQSLAIVSAIAVWGHAATANVVYSSRGLWSVLLVWLVGPWLGVQDAGLTRRVVASRVGGAILLLIAVALLVF